MLSESDIDSGSISSDSVDDAFWEKMARSAAKALIQLIFLPSEDDLNIPYPLVEPVVERSLFTTSSSKLKLLSTHKEIWKNLAHNLGISFFLALTYTSNYIFNPYLVAMAEEVISERSQGVSIDVESPNSDLIKNKQVHKKKKKSRSVAEMNPSSQYKEFNYDTLLEKGSHTKM